MPKPIPEPSPQLRVIIKTLIRQRRLVMIGLYATPPTRLPIIDVYGSLDDVKHTITINGVTYDTIVYQGPYEYKDLLDK